MIVAVLTSLVESQARLPVEDAVLCMSYLEVIVRAPVAPCKVVYNPDNWRNGNDRECYFSSSETYGIISTEGRPVNIFFFSFLFFFLFLLFVFFKKKNLLKKLRLVKKNSVHYRKRNDFGHSDSKQRRVAVVVVDDDDDELQ